MTSMVALPSLVNATQVQGLLGNAPGPLLMSLTQLLFEASSPRISGCLPHVGAERKGEHEAGWLNSFFVGIGVQAGANARGVVAVPALGCAVLSHPVDSGPESVVMGRALP